MNITGTNTGTAGRIGLGALSLLSLCLVLSQTLGWLPVFPYSVLVWRMPLAAPVAMASWKYGWRAGLPAFLISLVLLTFLMIAVDGFGDIAVLDAFMALVCLIMFTAGVYGHRNVLYFRSASARHELNFSLLQKQLESGRTMERRLASLNRVSSVLTQSLELGHVLKGAIDTVIEVMEVEVALIYMVDRLDSQLKLLAYDGVSTDFAKFFGELRLDEGYAGQAVRENRSIFIENASLEPGPGQAEMKRMRIQAQLLMPLRARGQLCGVLCVASRRPRVFQIDEVEILEVMADEVGVAMDNARLYQEQKRIAEALAVSERDFRSLFEKAHDAIWFHDLTGLTVAANNAALLLTGYSHDETKGMPVGKLLMPEGLKLARELKRRLLAGEQLLQPYEQELVRADGSMASVKLTTSLVTRDGQPSGFQHIARDVTLEKRMQENLRYYVSQVTRAQEEERKRIARELHDDTCQSLYAVSRQMDNYLRHNQNIPDHDVIFLKGIQQQIVDVLGGVRRFSQDLRPSVLDDLGLLPALQWLIRETERVYGLRGSLSVSGNPRRFSPEAEVSLFRILQEGLNNAGRHAKARNVMVRIEFQPDRAVITVADDGIGFEPPAALSDLTRHGKLGLAGMEERMMLLGGIIKLASKSGQGTEIGIEVPLGHLRAI